MSTKLPRIIETCPVCMIEFEAVAVRKNGQGSPQKTCPNMHTTPYPQLLAIRKTRPIADNGGAVQRQSIFAKARVVGVQGQLEVYQLAVAAMLGGFQVLMRTLPPKSQALALVQGAFGKAPELVERILEDENLTQQHLAHAAAAYLEQIKLKG